jgi:hypothetical protein
MNSSTNSKFWHDETPSREVGEGRSQPIDFTMRWCCVYGHPVNAAVASKRNYSFRLRRPSQTTRAKSAQYQQSSHGFVESLSRVRAACDLRRDQGQ